MDASVFGARGEGFACIISPAPGAVKTRNLATSRSPHPRYGVQRNRNAQYAEASFFVISRRRLVGLSLHNFSQAPAARSLTIYEIFAEADAQARALYSYRWGRKAEPLASVQRT